MQKILLSAAAAATIGISPTPGHATTFGGLVDMGGLTDFLYVFLDGSSKVNFNSGPQVGDIAVSGTADTSMSGNWDYSGDIVSGHTGAGDPDWARNNMVSSNPGNTVTFGQQAAIGGLQNDFNAAVTQIKSLDATDGFANRSLSSLNGVDVSALAQNLFVVNVTSGFSTNSAVRINGRADQFFIFRWDQNLSTAGFQGTVNFSGGGGLIPTGDLGPQNFLHVAGDLNSSGGGSRPAEFDDFNQELLDGGFGGMGSGGYFAGYWLTFGAGGGAPILDGDGNITGYTNGKTSSFSNFNLLGGWYTNTTEASIVSGSKALYVEPFADPLDPVDPGVIPLPAAGWLLLSGLGLFAAIGRRRMRASA